MPTAAQAYLLKLVEQHPLPELPAERTETVRKDLGLPPGHQFDFDSYDRVLHLLSELQSSLPAVAQQLIDSGGLAVGEVGISVPNAHIKRLDSDQFVVYLHSGLFSFLYRIARPLASAVFRPTQEAGTGIDMPELARVIAEVFWWLLKTGDSFGPEYPITLEQKHLANMLAMRAERFLLAHELGHVLVAMRMNADVGPSGELDDSMEEHLADVTALQLSLRACYRDGGDPDQMELMLTYAGAELALQIWGVMERIGLNFVDGAHPAATERLEMLRSSLRDCCETESACEAISMAAKVIAGAFDEVGQILQQPGIHATVFEDEAKALILDFQSLLTKCSTGRIPDYVTFYTDAPALLSRGYPESVLRAVFFEVVDSFKGSMGPDREVTDKADAIKKFNQFKLLLGLTERMPAPAKSIYSAALERLKE